MPGMAGSHLLDGCGHWVQQERPAEVNRLLTDWLSTLPYEASEASETTLPAPSRPGGPTPYRPVVHAPPRAAR
jgi:hypothetical protein